MNATPDDHRAVGLFDLPLGAVADATSDAIVLVDAQQVIVALNPAATRLFGVTAAAMIGQPVAALIPERLRARHAAHVQVFDAAGAQETRPMGRRGPIVGRRGDGSEFPAHASVSRVEVAVDGRHQRCFAVVLHELHPDIVAVNRRLRSVLALAPVALWITEGDRIVFANGAARNLLGASDEADPVGRTVFSLLAPAGHGAMRTALARAPAEHTTPQIMSCTLQRLDGELREVEIATAALPDHGQTVVQMVMTDVTDQRRQAQEDARHRDELRRLSAQLVDAREEERRRIARELHDELGQRLSALKMDLASLRTPCEAAGQAARLGELLEMLDDTVSAVRRIAADLRPLMLDDLGLNAAIESLAHDAAQRLDLDVTVQLGDADPAVGDAATIALYRMVQEALTNVHRHARATEVRVELRPAGDALVLTVRDNGIGFPADVLQDGGHFGLLGMRERALALGGQLAVDNPPGGGARITVRLPLAAAAPASGR